MKKVSDIATVTLTVTILDMSNALNIGADDGRKTEHGTVMAMREKLIEILRVPIYPHELADPTEVVADYLLDNDVVPVVRCKDCRYYDDTEGLQWCHLNSKLGKFAMDWHSFPEDGFCSYGERKSE